MSKKKVVLTSCAVLVCVVGGGMFTVNHFIDRQAILNQLYQTIEKQTGRKLALQDLDIQFLPWPEVKASKISLSNMANGKSPNFITAGHLKAGLNLWSLWNKNIHFKSIQLSHVQIHLERNEQGRKNWDLQPVETIKTNNIRNKQQTIHKKWKWQFNNVQLDDVECWYDDAIKHKSAHLSFKQAELNQLETNKVKFNLMGSHHLAEFEISGRISNFNELLAANETIAHPAKFQVTLTEYIQKQNIGNIRVSGTIKNFVNPKGYDLMVRGTILNLDSLNKLFPHANLPSVENITLNTAIKDISTDNDAKSKPQITLLQLHTGKANANLILSKLKVVSSEIVANDFNSVINTQLVTQIDGNLVRWSGQVGALKQIQDFLYSQTGDSIPISGTLSSDNYNAQLKGGIGGKNPLLEAKLNLLNYKHNLDGFGDFNAQNVTLIGKISIPFTLTTDIFKSPLSNILSSSNAEGKLKSGTVIINQSHFNDATTNFSLRNNKLFLSDIRLINKQSNIKGDVTYSFDQNPSSFNVKINAATFPMKWIESYYNLSNVYTGQITLSGQLQAQGNDWQAWQHSLTGKLGLFGTDGILEAQGLRHYIGQAASTLPLKKSLTTECLALRIQIKPDALYFDTMTLQTNKFSLTGQGDYSIVNQKLNFHLIPDVQLGVISASAPIRIGGTLSKPITTFDKNKNKVFSLNINALSKSAPQTDYCGPAIERAKTPLSISK